MFTGIIREIGIIEGLDMRGAVRRLSVRAKLLTVKAKEGDSVAVNGACLTVVGNKDSVLKFDVMKETLNVTTIGLLKKGDRVNLEPALELGENKSISGHLVTGHIDGVSSITNIIPRGAGTRQMEVKIDTAKTNLIVGKGSVAIEGVSLTISGVRADRFTVELIPYTLNETTLGTKRAGDKVNIEFDIIGKYVAKNIAAKRSDPITDGFLAEHGFL